jgi:hypothetical protein
MIQFNFHYPCTHRPWSRRQWLAVVAVAFGLWLLFSFLATGLDYFGCYTWMVTQPEKLQTVVDVSWTQNPPWMVPFMAPFVMTPGRAGYILFLAANLAMVVWGCYVFGGRPILTLLSAQMFWVLWWGQLEGWGVLGATLGWFALQSDSWGWMFLALAIGAFKPQVGFAPVAAAWWWLGRKRWWALIGILALTAASIAIWGPWPVWYVQDILRFVGDKHFVGWNASLGWIALPLYLLALLLPLTREQRLVALTATTLLASPYMPYYSTILLLCFDIPVWAYLFAFIGYLPRELGTGLAWNAIALLPLSVLVWLYWPVLRRWLQRRTGQLLNAAR